LPEKETITGNSFLSSFSTFTIKKDGVIFIIEIPLGSLIPSFLIGILLTPSFISERSSKYRDLILERVLTNDSGHLIRTSIPFNGGSVIDNPSGISPRSIGMNISVS